MLLGSRVVLVVVLAAALTQAPQIRTERRSAGDTTVVRTLGPAEAGMRRLVPVFTFGQVTGREEYLFGRISEMERAQDGTLLVFDGQVPILRHYDSTGRFIRNLGRGGQGPAEYRRVNGIAALPGGLIFVGDSDQDRVISYTRAGAHNATWTMPSGNSVGAITVLSDTAGNVWVEQQTHEFTPGVGFGNSTRTFLRHASDGRVVDSIPGPLYGKPLENIDRVARNAAGNATSRTRAQLPFQPSARIRWSPHGHVVATAADRYSIDLLKRGGRVTRIERDIPPVPVSAAERDEAVKVIEDQIRRVEPSFRFAGTIPRTRPPIRDLIVDDDGRIWVLAAVPAEKIPESERIAAAARAAATGRTGGSAGGVSPTGDWGDSYGFSWRVPIVFDVFSPEGNFLGRVTMPKGVMPSIMKGDFIWAVTPDSLDVQYITKFRILPPLR